MGVGRAYVPLIGMVTIMMNDYPVLKYLLIGGLALMVLIGNDKQQ
jgi:signal peptidase I